MADPKQVATFFDALAHAWAERAYDVKDTNAKFPSSKVRHHIAVDEIQQRVPKGTVLDMGCADGALVIDLAKRGYDVQGFDVSSEMVALAKKKYASESSLAYMDTDTVFSVSDFYSYQSDTTFDIICAMGFTEYLSSDHDFFSKVSSLLNVGGYVVADFRNILFSLSSANAYTLGLGASDVGKEALVALDTIEQFSPKKSTEIPSIVFDTYGAMQKDLAAIASQPQLPREKSLTLIHTQIDLRQSAPWIVQKEASQYGLELEYVVYFHLHPFPPRYEKQFPVLFNTMGIAMQPLGYTELGATISSSFVGIFKKIS